MRKASKAETKISLTLRRTCAAPIGTKSVLSRVDSLFRKMAGMSANRVQGMATQMDKSRTPWSAPSGNHEGSYRITQNHGAMTQAHCPMNWATAIIWVRS